MNDESTPLIRVFRATAILVSSLPVLAFCVYFPAAALSFLAGFVTMAVIVAVKEVLA